MLFDDLNLTFRYLKTKICDYLQNLNFKKIKCIAQKWRQPCLYLIATNIIQILNEICHELFWILLNK